MIDKAGMMILLVNSESPAWHSGLKVGDIILEIDGVKVNNINDYYAAMAASNNKKKTFRLVRDGDERVIEVSL
jgi:S1-C subfamily serine protease